MPEIARFYGEYMGEFNIQTGEMIQGDLPSKAVNLVKEWLFQYKHELQNMWNTQQITPLPPLE